MPSAHEGLNQVKSPILLPANPRWGVGDLIISLDDGNELSSPLAAASDRSEVRTLPHLGRPDPPCWRVSGPFRRPVWIGSFWLRSVLGNQRRMSVTGGDGRWAI